MIVTIQKGRGVKMKKVIVIISCMLLSIIFTACTKKNTVTPNDILNNLKNSGYSDATIDGTYLYFGNDYDVYLDFGEYGGIKSDDPVTLIMLQNYNQDTDFAPIFDSIIPLYVTDYKSDGSVIYKKIKKGLFDINENLNEEIDGVYYQNIGVNKKPPYLVINTGDAS